MFNVQQKPTESQLVYCTNQTKRSMKKLKRKPLSSQSDKRAIRWWEGFQEKVYLLSFEFRVKKMDSDSGDMGQMSLDNWVEKNEKKDDQD